MARLQNYIDEAYVPTGQEDIPIIAATLKVSGDITPALIDPCAADGETLLQLAAAWGITPEKTYGIVQGSGEENYTLADGRFFPMKTRWTATVIKDSDGRWRIRAIHIGTNFLDNPILAKAEKSLVWAGGIGAAAGVLTAGVLAWLICRRRRV